jgi:hypothetical protein
MDQRHERRLYSRYAAHDFKLSPFALAHSHDEVPSFRIRPKAATGCI